ncbi:MAG: glutamyl-tRNA reductase [Elusimicrobia bacterium]|nr:glutamyl-tRNA reductase [Elusimicrobiota bacterium]
MEIQRINLLGVNHKSCPVELREKLAVPTADIAGALRRLVSLGAREAVIVSTCNRVEIYWADDGCSGLREHILEDWRLKAAHDLSGHFYHHENLAAVEHLFRVSAGLDSMILGEPQILGQVRWAYQSSFEAKTTGRLLNPLFQSAIAAGKEARSLTGLAGGITSVSSAAVVLAEKIFGELSACRVMVLGAGKMAGAAARHFVSKKVESILVANRTSAKAEELARELGGQALLWEAVIERMEDVDVALCSTASADIILSESQVRALMKRRRGRPLFLIDIAVPRDVEPSAGRVPQVYLYDIDDLNAIVATYGKAKAEAARKAETFVAGKAVKFWSGRTLAPASVERVGGPLPVLLPSNARLSHA